MIMMIMDMLCDLSLGASCVVETVVGNALPQGDTSLHSIDFSQILSKQYLPVIFRRQPF